MTDQGLLSPPINYRTMKTKLLFLSILLGSVLSGMAQEADDALRYSYLTGQGGTARTKAIGGAGGSLGGDFSSLFINPAGIALNKTGDFVITPNFWMKKSNSTYLNEGASAKGNKFNLGATGVMFSTPSRGGHSVRNVTIGIGINRLADFNNHVYYQGINKSTSFAEQYLEQLINNNETDANNAASNYPFGPSMAFNTFLIDTLANPDQTIAGYQSLPNPTTGLLQENDISTSGGLTDASLGVGVNLKDKWYFGGTFSFPFLNYRRQANYRESDASEDPNNYFNFFEANESLETKGVGINGKFGLIFKPTEDVRLGLAVHTPTLYMLTDYYNMQIITDLEGYAGAGQLEQNSTDLNDGNRLRTRYNMTTPFRAIFSGSYIVRAVSDVTQQRGFLTADVEYVNYAGSAFHDVQNSQDYKTYYASVNENIDQLYRDAINVRVGGELKFNTLMVRLGGAYYGNPYKIDEEKNVTNISGGLGYRNKGFYIDLTYTYSMTKDQQYPYILQDKPNMPAYLKNNGSNIIATFGFKL